MLRIYIVRHATAQDRNEILPDFERPLVKKGEKEAAAVARYLVSKDAAPDLMISSFANRAIETAHLFAKAFRYPRQKILLREAFYGSTNIDDLVRDIRKQPDRCRSLMLFGHDPAFSQLAAHLVKEFRETIPKAGVVAAEFPVGRWRDVESGSGRLVLFTGPARLKEQKRQARDELETRLARSMQGALARFNRPGARAFQKEVRKSARRVVKGFLKTLNGRSPAGLRKQEPRAALTMAPRIKRHGPRGG
jgi:phosphohistidine phosphatase